MAIKTSFADINNSGDKIICRYTASSNNLGVFNEFGSSVTSLIPAISSATPDGSFYFQYTGNDSSGRKRFIADRNIQHSINWDTLNTTGIINELDISTKIINISAESDYLSSSYIPSMAFDGINDSTHQWHTKTTFPHILQFEYIDDVSINQYSISSSIANSLKTWYFEGYNTNTSSWDTLHSIVGGIQWDADGAIKNYTFSNSNNYKKYRLRITAGYRAEGYCSVWELTPTAIPIKNKYYIKLMSGGTSITDTNNDWDNIIVNSTLNGTITAGDNNIWNWNGIYSWTSTTNINGSTYKTVRGNNSVNYSNNYNSSVSSTTIGFRPVLLVESLIKNKYLIKQNSNYYTIKTINYDSTTSHNFIPLSLTGGTTPNKSDIETFGFEDLNLLTNSMTVNTDIFIPVSKFDNNTELKMYKPS